MADQGHQFRRIDPIPPAARPLQGLRAGVVSRTIAGAVDYAIIALLVAGTYVGIVVIRFLVDPRSAGSLPTVPLAVVLLYGFGLMVIYLWIAFATTGRTAGDRLMGLRVVGLTGSRMRWWAALVRAVFCTVFPVGLFWCAVSRENRSVQDVVLRSSVIHHWPVPVLVEELTDVDHRSEL